MGIIMKILMINVVCGVRSTGRICTDLAEALEEQGHEVKIAYGRETVPQKYERYAVRIGGDTDVRLHALLARTADRAGFGSTAATRRFLHWVEEYDPDVIHLHNIHGYYINVELLFAYLKKCGKRIIWTLHDCWAFTGHSAFCDAADCTRWVDGCFRCPNRTSYPKSYLDRSRDNWKRKRACFSDISDMIIVTPSDWLAALVKKSYLKGNRVVTIHNGIDLSGFRRRENAGEQKETYGLGGKTVLLGVAAVWDERKGLDTFIRLAESLPEEFRIMLVGVTARQIAALPEKIVGLERTDSVEQLREIYAMADVFLNPTMEDNYPTTNMEAIACGTPVITYATGGSGESVGEGCGFVIEKGNFDRLRETILQKKYLELAEDGEAFRKQTACFDKYVMLQSYLQLYGEKERAYE